MTKNFFHDILILVTNILFVKKTNNIQEEMFMKKVLSFALALLMLVSAISVASAEAVTTIK